MKRHRLIAPISAFVALFILFSGCKTGPKYQTNSYVDGTLKIRAEVDSTGDYSGFRISVLSQLEGDVDTLGTAITDEKGSFTMMVSAPEAGVYPIVVDWNGTTPTVDDIVVVDGDSVHVTAAFPVGPSGLRIVSLENGAWTAYTNAKAGHNQQMLKVLRSASYSPSDIGRVTAQTSSILWNIPTAYPNTIGSEIAMAESVVMMEGWSDSTVISRLPLVSLENPSIVEVVRAARRSVARAQGADSAIALLDRYLLLLPVERRAGLMAEKVIAYSDSFQTADAVRTATELKKLYPKSNWAAWAGRATYELENLQPGMNAPAYRLTTRVGEEVSTASMKGKFVILEFFDPFEKIFQREFEARDGITEALDDRLFETISLSVEQDSVVNEALFDGTTHPGQFVWLGDGMAAQVIKDFNVQILPTRYLLDPEGVIVSKYSGPSIGNLEEDLASIVLELNELPKLSN